jgi:hypothetical protein
MAKRERGPLERTRLAAEPYAIRLKGWAKLSLQLLGLVLVVLGGALLFAQTGAIGIEYSTAVMTLLQSAAISTNVGWLWYIASGLVIFLIASR